MEKLTLQVGSKTDNQIYLNKNLAELRKSKARFLLNLFKDAKGN